MEYVNSKLLKEFSKELEKDLNIKEVIIEQDFRKVYFSIGYKTDKKSATFKSHYFILKGNRKGYKNNEKSTAQYFIESVSNMCGFGCTNWDAKDFKKEAFTKLDLEIKKRFNKFIK